MAQDLWTALRVSKDRSLRVLFLCLKDVGFGDGHMHRAVPREEDELSPGAGSHVLGKVLVGNKEDFFILRKAPFYDLGCICRGAHKVAFGFHRSVGIHVAENPCSRVFCLEISEVLKGEHIGHGASCFRVGNKDFFLRGEDFCRLSHEVHPAENDDAAGGVFRRNAQAQRIPYKIGHFLHFRKSVVMGKDNGMLLLFQLADFLDYAHRARPPQ